MPTLKSSDNGYVLGHSGPELQRLHRQAHLINPITERFLIEAGLSEGFRVLDVGCGGGDVSLLAAGIVGATGEVVGVDRSPLAVKRATERAVALGSGNVSFRESDLSDISFERDFDAVIGRYVLCFQKDPASLLKSLSRFLRRGGIMLFHEPDRAQMRSYPPALTYDRACQWVTEAYIRSGVDVRLGVKLYAIFLAAGLPPPTMRLHAVIGGAEAIDEIHLDADQAEIIARDIQRLGIATAEDLQIDTLFDRIRDELAANKSVIIGRGEIGAWSYL